MKKIKGFTLVELLAVIVVLLLIFMFVAPKITSLIKEGENTSADIIKGRVIDAAKEYASRDGTFFTTFINEGDNKIISKKNLLDSHLIDSKDIDKLEGFGGVKVELLSDDKFEYTIVYE